jgi:hypothetical protein
MTLLADALSAVAAFIGGPPIAALDVRAYSPLCLLIGSGCGTIVLQGFAR